MQLRYPRESMSESKKYIAIKEKQDGTHERNRDFRYPCTFTEKRIDHDAVYPGMYRYELETVNNGPKRVSDTASGTFLGTVLTPVPIPMDNGQRELAPDDLMLDAEAGSWTPQEFEEKYLSPNGENGGR